MKNRIALLATILNAVAWFMPAYQESSYERFPAGPMLMGWQAFKGYGPPSDLHEGYYVWLGSFAILALALRHQLKMRANPRT